MSIFFLVYMCSVFGFGAHGDQKRQLRCPGSGVPDDYGPLNGCWESSLGPCLVQQVLLRTKSFLRSPN